MLSKEKLDFFPSFSQIAFFLWNLLSTITFINLSFVLIIWSSAFIYLTFYYIYIPISTYQHLINFQFDSDCLKDCNHPYAEVALNDYKTPFLFAKGQSYKFLVELDLPESNVNWDQGMFMLRLQLIDEKGNLISDTATSSILQYKSPLLRIITLIFYWPFLIFNFKQEAQHLSIPLHKNYIDNIIQGKGPAILAKLIVEARNIQIYSAVLKIEANLKGLRYYMVNWPITSAFLSTISISFFLSMITVCSLFRNMSSKNQESINEE